MRLSIAKISVSLIVCLWFSHAVAMQSPADFLRKKSDTGVVPYYYVEDCDKDGAIVASRVSSAMCGVSETRTLDIRADRNLVGAGYLETRCKQTCGYYKQAGLGTNPLLRNDCVVMGSVHELGLYTAETLHAPFLPLQYLGFSDTWTRVEQTPGIKIVMADYGVHDKLWVWCKVGQRRDVPVAYLEVLAKSKDLFIIRSTETEESYNYRGKYHGCYIHSSVDIHEFTRNAVSSLPIETLAESERLALRQHEWGLPDATIVAMRDVWVKVLRKRSLNFHVVEGDTVSLFVAIPSLWEQYLNANYRRVEGITFNSYWVAHPSYERRLNLIPLHFYRFKDSRQEWEPYDATIQAVVARNWNNDRPFIVRSFVNNIGSGPGEFSDVEELKIFLIENDLWSGNENIDPYFSVGFDCTGYRCEGYDGEILEDIPSTKVRQWMDQTQGGAIMDRLMRPLSLGAIFVITTMFDLYKIKSRL